MKVEARVTRRGLRFQSIVSDEKDEPAGLTWLIRHDPDLGSVGPTSEIEWQAGPVPLVGRTGFQPAELLEVVAERLRSLNAALPSRETSTAITHIETAILWLDERTRDREARGVEGTHEP